jgi:hypothetical protein
LSVDVGFTGGNRFWFFVVFFGLAVVHVLSGIPGVFSQRVVAHGARFYDDVFLEAGALEIQRCSLQAVEQKAGGFGFEVFSDDKAEDLHDGDLDGVGVFKDRQVERIDELERAGLVEIDVGFTPAIVKETETAALQRWRTALRTVDFDVLTTSDGTGIDRHEERSNPHPSGLVESRGWEEIPGKSLPGKGL